ncbi:MAG: GatB/YqeY domain-containing protein [Syntrophomonadaceae bacterium]
MSLSDKLLADMKEAMKQREKTRLATIRMVRAAIKDAEINKHVELTDDEITEIISRQVKIRKDAIPDYQKANRPDSIQQLQDEIKVLQSYLPEQLSEDELRSVIRDTIMEIGAQGQQDIGKVMKNLMPKLKGRADGKQINQLVKEMLN